MRNLFATTLTALLITGCNGSGDSSTETSTYTLTAIDGYLSSAEVYIDFNSNGAADPNEYIGTTDVDAQIELEEEHRDYAVIVRVVAGQTKDCDYQNNSNGGIATRTYEMIAAPGSDFVTPLTTIAYLYDLQPAQLVATLDPSSVFGLSESILSNDYMDLEWSDDLQVAEAATAAHILSRSVALVLGETIASNYDDSGSAPTERLTKSISLLQTALKAELETIDAFPIYNRLYVLDLDGDGDVTNFVATDTLSVHTGVVESLYAINDTGATACFSTAIDATNGLTVSKKPCDDPTVHANQDAHYGRDNRMIFNINDNNNGSAGFNFSKINHSGETLNDNAANWDCVQDNITGLMWEVKTYNESNPGLRDKTYNYSWYNSDASNNGGNLGTKNGGSCYESGQCDTQSYTESVNNAALCGYSDWRIPTREEILSIVHFGEQHPAIDHSYFPNAGANRNDDGSYVSGSYPYWTKTSYASDSESAWAISRKGEPFPVPKSLSWSVRLVRGGLSWQ